MIDPELPEDLARLELALAGRPLPRPNPDLRLRALSAVRRARANERALLAVAAFGVVLATLGVLAPARPATRETPPVASAPAVVDEALLERLGYDPAGARVAVLAMHLARVPRLAPPLGSGSAGAGWMEAEGREGR